MFDRRGGKMLFFQPLRKQLVAVYARKTFGQHAAAIQIAAERDMSVSPELQKMLDMTPDVFQCRPALIA